MRIALLLLVLIIPKFVNSQALECDKYYIFDLRDSMINASPVVVFKMYTDINTANAGSYTSLCFIDQHSDTLNPRPVYAYNTPVANTSYDTQKYVLYYDDGFSSFPKDFNGILLMEVPDCAIPYNHTLLSSPNLSLQDIGIQIFPNPFDNDIQILNETDIKLTEIKLYDMRGSLILSQDQNLDLIDTHSIKKGVYLMKFFSDGEEIGTQKMIKQ